MTNLNRPPGLIQHYREELQARHYARRTVSSYEHWLRRFLRFHQVPPRRTRRWRPCCFSIAPCWVGMWGTWRA